MKAATILSAAFLAAALSGCEQSSQPRSESRPDGRKIGPAINVVARTAATQAGYGISRASVDTNFDAFSSEWINAMQSIGICDNFIQLEQEVVNAGSANAEAALLASPRFQAVVSCLETEASSLSGEQSTDQIFALMDKCFCDGSGSVFGAIAAFAWKNYSAPKLDTYHPPQIDGYKTPSLQGYQAPSLPGYRAPAIQ